MAGGGLSALVGVACAGTLLLLTPVVCRPKLVRLATRFGNFLTKGVEDLAANVSISARARTVINKCTNKLRIHNKLVLLGVLER